MTSAQLRNKQSEGSSLKGSQKLFFSLQKRRGGEDDIFVNNARITARDLAFTSEDGSNQVRINVTLGLMLVGEHQNGSFCWAFYNKDTLLIDL